MNTLGLGSEYRWEALTWGVSGRPDYEGTLWILVGELLANLDLGELLNEKMR